MNKNVFTTAASAFALVLALGTTAEALGLGGLGLGGGGGRGDSGAGSRGNAGANARGTARGSVGVGAAIGRGGISAGARVGGLGVGASVDRGGINAGISAGSRSIGASAGVGGISTSASGAGAGAGDADAGRTAIGNGKLSPARIRALLREARSPDLVKRRAAQKILAENGVSMSPRRNPLARVDIDAGATRATATLDQRAATRGRIADVKVNAGNAVKTRASLGNRKAAPGVGPVAQVDADALGGAAKTRASIGDRAADLGNVADVKLEAGETAKARASVGNANAAPGTGTIAQVDANALDDTVKAAASVGENNLRRGNVADLKLGAGDTAGARASIGNENAAPGVGSVAQIDAGAREAAEAGISVGDRAAARGNIANVNLDAGDGASAEASIGNKDAAPGTGTIAQVDAQAIDAATADVSIGRNAAVEPDGATVDGIGTALGVSAAGASGGTGATVGLRRSGAAAASLVAAADESLRTDAPIDAETAVGARLGVAPDESTAGVRLATEANAVPAGTGTEAPGTVNARADIGLGLGDEDGNPAAPGTGMPGQPGTPTTVAGLSDNERRSLEKRCAPVQASPEKYARSVIALCQGL